ncbi:PREDICTED: proline-rich receptor-like protein kinase PERK2 [Camelina sativa]|uniref:Proline-rich receptor-like protein kinase PERK2 n=1 Tax=Camelina sativa TaxID=90675 RepID=A0ABM0ZI02_CAMSA|nr:PREDICTED: proline-rich receptor-like protein kinase PERK2 [Camelina sativa]
MAARANNKYTSINFNHILHKDPPSSSSSPYSSNSSPASYSSVARSNGRMLVLTKPSPKPLRSPSPVTTTITTPSLSPAPMISDQAVSDPDPNQISLRPLGHTGPGSSLSFPVRTPEKVLDVPPPAPLMSMSPKPNKFVPPHLRPGFVRKDEKPRLDSNPNLNQEQPRQGYFGYGQTGRPKSGGYERIRTDPRSTGNRPGTSG